MSDDAYKVIQNLSESNSKSPVTSIEVIFQVN
jgi:hypothetical protein